MAVTKVNGFVAPYRSATFQQQVDKITQMSGLLKMDGVVETISGQVHIPPIEFVQNGLLVADSLARQLPEPTQEAPYYLTVSAASSVVIDDLIYSFPKNPSDIVASQIIVGYFDGVEWRKPEIVSIAGVYDEFHQTNADFMRIGPVSGLLTTYSGGVYDNSPGVLVDKTGRRQRLSDIASYPEVPVDNDFNRVDRIVYRQPTDVQGRIGFRKFVLGGAYSETPTGLYNTVAIPASEGIQLNVKTLIDSNNDAHIITSKGYGGIYFLEYVKYDSTRQTELIAPVVVASDVSDTYFDAVLDSADKIHIVYAKNVATLPTVKHAIQHLTLSSVGAVITDTNIHTHASASVTKPAIAYNVTLDTLYVVDQAALGAGNSKIFYYTIQATSGSAGVLPLQLAMTGANLHNADIAVSDEIIIYVVAEDQTTGRIYYGIFDDLGGVITAAQNISGNTQIIAGGTLADSAQLPKVLVSNDNIPFVTFLQDWGGSKYGMSIYTEGTAFTQHLDSSSENFLNYDVVMDDFLNGLHFLINGTSFGVRYVKVEGQAIQFSYQIESLSCQFVATARDRLGAMFHVRTLPAPGTYSSYDTNAAVAALGAGSFGAGLIIPVLGSKQLAILASEISAPTMGDRIVITNADAPNNGTYVVESTPLETVFTASDYYWIIDVTTAFDHPQRPTSPSPIRADMQAPDGSEAKFIKTNSEIKSKAHRFDILDCDLLLARISFPGPIILNYENNSAGPVEADTQRVIAYGKGLILDWDSASPNALVINKPFYLNDLVNNFTYTIAAGNYGMSEGQALYVMMDLNNFNVTPMVTSIETLPFATPIQVLGIIKEGQFVQHAVLSAINTDRNLLVVGSNDGNPGDYDDLWAAITAAHDGSKIIVTEDQTLSTNVTINKNITIEFLAGKKIHVDALVLGNVITFDGPVKTKHVQVLVDVAGTYGNILNFTGLDGHHTDIFLELGNVTVDKGFMVNVSADATYIDGLIKYPTALLADVCYNNSSTTNHNVVIRDLTSGIVRDLFNRLPPIQEMLAGTVDGSNTDFTLSRVPSAYSGVLVMVDSIPRFQGMHYTISGTTVTFLAGFVPQFGQDVYAYYLPSGLVGTPPPSGGGSGAVEVRSSGVMVAAAATVFDFDSTLSVVIDPFNSNKVNITALGGGGGGAIGDVVYHTVNSTDLLNKYFILPHTPTSQSKVICDIIGGTGQIPGVDFQIASGTHFDWNGLGLDGSLTLGQVLRIQYPY